MMSLIAPLELDKVRSEVIMRRLLSAFSFVALLQSAAIVAHSQTQPAPNLVSDPVEQVTAAGLMTKYSDGKFHAENLVSRAELASILVKTFQLDNRAAAKREAAIPVGDVPTSYWAYQDIQIALKTGTMKGYRGNLFYPNQKITRAEAFAILAQAYGVFQFPDSTVEAILSQYPDANQVPGWAKKAMATALDSGFVNVDASSNINPSKPITRGDLAYALSQYLTQQRTPTSAPAPTPTPTPESSSSPSAIPTNKPN
jgi:hypothetical protein